MPSRSECSEARLLPSDCVLLPLARGRLLVSPEQALFCRIHESEVARVQRLIRDPFRLDDVPANLVERLERHGFGGPPRSAPPVQPTVQLQLTNACNLNCAYCCTDSGVARPSEVSREQLFRVVDEARSTMGSNTRFGMIGGEPFLVPWAIELAEYIRRLGSPLVMYSNGLALDDGALRERVATLVRGGAELRLSLSAVTAEDCDSLSGARRFEQAIAVIEALHRADAAPFVDVMLLPSAVTAAAAALPSLRRRLPSGIQIHFGILYRAGRERGRHLFQSRRALEAALDYITFEAGETIPGNLEQPIAERREGCTCALGHHLHVRSDGALYGCFKMVEQLGHLEIQSFAEVASAAASRARPARMLPLCALCPLATLCGGGCRTENLEWTGDADRPFCGPWRVEVSAELLAEDRPYALEWSIEHLLSEAKARGIAVPSTSAAERLVCPSQ